MNGEKIEPFFSKNPLKTKDEVAKYIKHFENKGKFIDDSKLTFAEKISKEREWLKDEKRILNQDYTSYVPAFQIPEAAKLGLEVFGGVGIGHTLRHTWKHRKELGSLPIRDIRASVIATTVASAALLLDLAMHRNHEIKHSFHEIDDKVKWLDRFEEEQKKLQDNKNQTSR